MKNVPIKFRGVDFATGNFVFGRDFMQYSDTDVWIGDNDLPKNYPVKDVTLLVGYDADGNEVYEGDIMTDVAGNKYIAHFDSRVLWEGSKTFKHWTLPFRQSSSDYEECSLPMEFFNEVEKKRRKTDWLKKE